MRWRLNQRKDCRAVWGCHRDEPFTRFHARVERQLKPERVEEESKAAFLISDVHVDGVHAQERIARAGILGPSSHCVIIGAAEVTLGASAPLRQSVPILAR